MAMSLLRLNKLCRRKYIHALELKAQAITTIVVVKVALGTNLVLRL